MMQRIKRIFNNLGKEDVDIVLKNSNVPDPNFYYVTGLTQGLHEGSIAVIHPDGGLDLLTSTLEAEIAEQAKDAAVHVFLTAMERDNMLRKVINTSHAVGLNYQNISYQEYLHLNNMVSDSAFIDVSGALNKTRSIKDPEEIRHIRKACEIADRVAEKIPELIQPDMTENDLAAHINYLMQRYGAEKPAFDTISSFGANSSQPHYTHGDTTLKSGDLVLCDYGACYHKYNSDTTRTLVYGHADAIQKEIYEIVEHAQQIALDIIQPGITGAEVHQAAQDHIDSTIYAGRFIHTLGHSLGLETHDGGPGFTPRNTLPIEPGMVITVEPGIYLPDLGGVRIEDDILITQDGYESLTKSSKEFRELPISLKRI